MIIREIKTGETERQCPNCDHYNVASLTWYELEWRDIPYSGWRWWKDTTQKLEKVDDGEGFGCSNCGWRDWYE